MLNTISVKNAGAWVTAEPSVHHQGVWKTPLEVWTKNTGVWQLVYGIPYTFLDPTKTAADFTLSNNNLTVTKTGNDGTNSSSLSIGNRGISTKLYAEARLDLDVVQDSCGIGVSDIDQPLTGVQGWVGGTPHSVGVYPGSGTIYYDGADAGVPSIGHVNNGDTLAIAVDNDAATVQFRNVTQAGGWSAVVSISGLTPGQRHVGLTVSGLNEQWTANFDGPFLGAVPSGFTRWGA